MFIALSYNYCMFKYILNMFRPAKSVEKPVKTCPRSKQAQLDAILLSFRYGKIKHDTAVSLIDLWARKFYAKDRD